MVEDEGDDASAEGRAQMTGLPVPQVRETAPAYGYSQDNEGNIPLVVVQPCTERV